jgi:hypothetical protein
MDEAERRALAALPLNWAPTPDDVWRPSPYHVEGLHRPILDLILERMAEATKSVGSPIGVALEGYRGTGKTHLLGTVRERVQADGGYFFLVELLEAKAFWRCTAMSILDGFARPRADDETQLVYFLKQLSEVVDAPRPVRRAVIGEYELTRPALDAFVDLLRKHDRQIGMECQDTLRALVLQTADSLAAQDVGYGFLCSNDEEESGDRAAWGMRRGKRSAQEIVRDVSRLLALTERPTLIAVDQIDLLVAQSVKSTAGGGRTDWQTSLLLEQIASGLMALRESTRRSLSVVACLPQTWREIKQQVTDTVQDRFHEAEWLKEIPSPDLGRELVARRFTGRFDEVGFTAPYPTWPIRPEAFEEAVQFTPRELLRTVDRHVRACLAADQVSELWHLLAAAGAEALPAIVAPAQPDSVFEAYDSRYTELCAAAETATALDQRTEDAVVPALLRAGLTAWVAERGAAGEEFSIDPQAGGKPALHARLRQAIGGNAEIEDEAHWSFRAICAPHPIAALNRIRNAITTAGLTEGVTKRRLFLLRTPKWSSGSRTQEVLDQFKKDGGVTLPLSEADIARLAGLRNLIAQHGEDALRPWFASRRPSAAITVLSDVLAEAVPMMVRAPDPLPVGAPDPLPVRAPGPRPATVPARGRAPVPSQRILPPEVLRPSALADRAGWVGWGNDRADRLTIGTTDEGGVDIPLEALRRHTAIFAGSGSGKTVLIRRLIEECARRGVSSIVLDPNNDLARLGDAHPEPPDSWWPGDAERAADYLANTDVVVWTPRRTGGRPLSFQPLPNFAEIRDDPDALEAGIDVAVAALAPHARADGTTERARLSQAVLREALTSFATGGGSDLRGLVQLLGDLPDGVSDLEEEGTRLAGKMAQLLRAAMINDPVFGGRGAAIDPGDLLTPPPGKRARVSVISFVGLPDDRQRQTFVNQLQVALFAWIKQHPANDRPLGGLLVMDEAQTLAPSGAMTPCTHSTLMLASQARKYGLGLVFATQAPKGLHNRIPGNAATQFFGLLTSMTQIDAAQEIARVKGSPIPDVGRLERGEFYAAVEGDEFLRMRAPFCLSYHPKSPLTNEEVIRRAAVGA